MQASISGAVTPQKLSHHLQQGPISTPDHTFKFRLEDASPETEKVISYLRDLKQSTANSAPRRSKPQSLPFSVKENLTSKLSITNTSQTKGPLGLINITVCTCTCTNTPSTSTPLSTSSSNIQKNLITREKKCISHPSPSPSSSDPSQKENIHPNNNARILKPSTNRRQPLPPAAVPLKKREQKEDKMRKEGPNPKWDMQFQQVKVRQVKCEQVKMYPSNLPYALVYIFS